jgi:hypothetical protein
MRALIIANIAFVLTFSSAAKAQNADIELMREPCRNLAQGGVSGSTIQTSLSYECLGIIKGTIALEEAYRTATREQNLWFCLPRGLTFAQMAQVIVSYMDQNPRVPHANFGFVVLGAFGQAWPCRR